MGPQIDETMSAECACTYVFHLLIMLPILHAQSLPLGTPLVTPVIVRHVHIMTCEPSHLLRPKRRP